MAQSISKKTKTDNELCQIISTSVTEIVRNSLNPDFRQSYFDTIQVTNSTDAQNSLENKLEDLLSANKTREKKKEIKDDKITLENYLASKILRPIDVKDKRKHSEMTSLIKHLLKIDSKSNQQITKNHEILSAANIFSYSILKSGESTNENKKEWTNVIKHKKERKEAKNKRFKIEMAK